MLEVLYLRETTEPAMNQIWREGGGYRLGLKASKDLMAFIYLYVDDILSHIPVIMEIHQEVFMSTALCLQYWEWYCEHTPQLAIASYDKCCC